MHIEPRRPAIRCEILNRQLKIWRSRKINGCHAEKLLRLWLGYDFLDLMDEHGRIIRRHFNEVRRRLKYEQSSDMLAEIRSSQSFYIVGNSEEDILAICSPVWHQYDNQEGMLLSGSIPIDESEIQSGILTHNIDNHNIDNPNGVTAEAVSLERDREAKRKIVRNYFEWLQRRTDICHFLRVAKENGVDLQKYYLAPPRPIRGREIYKFEPTMQESSTSNSKQSNSSPRGGWEGAPGSFDTLDPQWITACLSCQSSFVRALIGCDILTDEEAACAAELYRLGCTRDGSVIFWQIDEQGLVRDGKTMLYDQDCHRSRAPQAVNWVSYLLKHPQSPTPDPPEGGSKRMAPLIPLSWKGQHCLFGLHLLHRHGPVNIVEAEKTAVICSQKIPGVWMATGGKGELSLRKLLPLKGRKVVLFPDTDTSGETYQLWRSIAYQSHEELGLDILTSDILERCATPQQKERKIDIADFLYESSPPPPPIEEDQSKASRLTLPLKQQSPELAEMCADNPALDRLIQVLDQPETEYNVCR